MGAVLTTSSSRPAPGTRTAPHRLLLAALCVALILLGGCSALRLSYGQADRFTYYWIDRYVDFDAAQSQRVRDAIGSFFTWNRRTQLVDYANMLARIDAEVQTDTTPERACTWWTTVRTHLDRSVEQAVALIADNAVTLRPAQIENIEARYTKMNAEFRDEFMQSDPAKRHSEAAKRAISRYEWLYGDLDTLQKERIERWTGESPFDPKLSMDERRRRQQDALTVLRQLPRAPVDSATAQAQIRGWLQRFDPPPRETYRLHAERVVRHNCRVFAAVHNSTSVAQRQVASRRLRGWAADLRVLAAEAGE